LPNKHAHAEGKRKGGNAKEQIPKKEKAAKLMHVSARER